MTNNTIKDLIYQSEVDGRVWVVDQGGHKMWPLANHGPHSVDHSWGYSGSGPAQLAKDILHDHMGAEPTSALYQDFKVAHVARFGKDRPFEIPTSTIVEFIMQWLGVNPGMALAVDGI